PPARLPVAGAEVDTRPHDVPGGDAGLEQPEHRLGHDEGDPLLQPALQPLLEVGTTVGFGGDDHHDPAIVDLDGVGPHVVGPGVEGAARAEVEAGVVPVAGHEAALDRAAMQRETHVGAAVVDGEGGAVAPEDADRLRAGLAGETAGPLQLGHRPDRDAIVHRPTFHPMSTAGLHIEARGEGPAVVFTHGFGRTGEAWLPVADALAADHHTVVWDMRGHGRSPAPAGLYTRADALADLGAVVDAAMAAGGGPVLLVGHSLGGYFSLAYTLGRPETVRGLVLLSTGPGFRNPESMAKYNRGVATMAAAAGLADNVAN